MYSYTMSTARNPLRRLTAGAMNSLSKPARMTQRTSPSSSSATRLMWRRTSDRYVFLALCVCRSMFEQLLRYVVGHPEACHDLVPV